MSYTRTHVYVEWANPFLACDRCKQRVTGWHDPQQCGCDGPSYLLPCEHGAGETSECPSWSPVDGCKCLDHLGYVPHAPAEAS